MYSSLSNGELVSSAKKPSFSKALLLPLLISSLLRTEYTLAALSDTTPPVLTGFAFSSQNPFGSPIPEVDVRFSDYSLQFTISARDDLSGLSYAYVYFSSPSGAQRRDLFVLFPGGGNIGSGNGSLPIPKFSESGTWIIDKIELFDKAGNRQAIDRFAISALGFSTTFRVVSNSDLTAPSLNSISFNPLAVDVSQAGATINLNLDLIDSESGVNNSACVAICSQTVALVSPTGRQVIRLFAFDSTLISGTNNAGVFALPITIPRYSESGSWKLDYLQISDRVGNKKTYSAFELQALGLSTGLTVTSNPSDTQLPQITNVQISPNFVDTTTGSRSIVLTLGATDNLAGLGTQGIYSSYFQFRSPSGNQSVYMFVNSALSGTPTSGTWQAVGQLPQYSEAGTWKLSQATISDAAGNGIFYNASQWEALSFPASFDVILPSLVVDGTIPSLASGGTVIDDVFGNRAQLVVPPGVLNSNQPSTVSLDVLNSSVNLPIPTGFSTNGTNFVNIKLNPEPTPPFPAPGLTVVLPLLAQMEPGTQLTLYRIDPVSGSLTPEPGIGGGAANGTVNADRLSATFTGVASLSTVVGLIPNGTVLGDVNADNQVNCADIAIVKAAFGKKLGQPGFDSRADTNRDNVVNIRDLTFVSRKLPSELICRVSVASTPSAPSAVDQIRK